MSSINRTCRACGCTDTKACRAPDGLGCHWVLLDIWDATGVCSLCADQLGWDASLLAGVGIDFHFEDYLMEQGTS